MGQRKLMYGNSVSVLGLYRAFHEWSVFKRASKQISDVPEKMRGVAMLKNYNQGGATITHKISKANSSFHVK